MHKKLIILVDSRSINKHWNNTWGNSWKAPDVSWFWSEDPPMTTTGLEMMSQYKRCIKNIKYKNT